MDVARFPFHYIPAHRDNFFGVYLGKQKWYDNSFKMELRPELEGRNVELNIVSTFSQFKRGTEDAIAETLHVGPTVVKLLSIAYSVGEEDFNRKTRVRQIQAKVGYLMATKTLANWATNLDSLPPSVERAALRSLYNYIGCAIGGAFHPTVTKAHAALSPFFGRETSSLLGHRGQSLADAQHAALLNGIASHVHDYDDTHLATIIHPTGPVASALLAYAEYRGNVSGAEILVALVAGIEASCKCGLAVWPEHYDIGWHITSTTGSIGAAVGVGRLMGLGEAEMAHAIGLAAVQVTGLREMFGSDTKSFHPGRSAQNGLVAALMAQKGYTSSLQGLEAQRGWANVVAGGGTPILDQKFSGLGKEWEIESNSFKPFPCGIVCHPVIDAAIHLHAEMALREMDISEVDQVEAAVHPLVIELTSKKRPKDGLEGKFSVFHGCAVGLLYGKAGPTEYLDNVVTDPEVIVVRDKIDATADQSLLPDEAYLQVTFLDGTSFQKHIRHAVGSLQVPMTDEQLTEKFVDQATRLFQREGARNTSDLAWQIGRADDISVVLRQL